MERIAQISRKTKETDIKIRLNIDGEGKSNIDTKVKFFDHMLEAFTKHGFFDLDVIVDGDIDVDDHHTVEDTAIVLGECFKEALGDKVGINRMAYAVVPMDEALANVAVDIGGRNYTVFKADFEYQSISDLSTQNIKHFMETFANNSLMNINIKAEGENDHHICEAIFKALARALNDATKITHNQILSTKGTF
ncbi:MAG: imidazoleglycerol-phosphate dehydratase HisB [Methanosphaera sp.]|uniref:imidazoleglycerol-phosphate dehydratase HisB n=1 Tax=Methanosphaera sp. TaxID=2666342 RepID=UPI0025D7D5DF|nr:imidazoleglycerol-phosphate dehydratase HisB [Methanosphaera sp.]MCI5867596.1 imidazoleglycerol-phosphate dehydratase HisB [Methanosphaera sp.]MDD6534063.1 imidazoleglycerol-phosphate dehydratase HisB [Methanosphaera sp.]MDY3956127.1 imidazoleglycerol-phosphate dehydratase HisB [Methanosphaera sp.]